MPTCEKCGDHFPWRTKIGGVRKYLGSRKYCLKCSPYNCHNTRQLDRDLSEDRGRCQMCGKEMPTQRRRICNACSVKRGHQRRWKCFLKIRGDQCVFCGYGGGARACLLAMHHVKEKTCGVNTGSLRYGKVRFIKEAKKCVPACPNCHAEAHAEIISKIAQQKRLAEFWSKDRIDLANRWMEGEIV